MTPFTNKNIGNALQVHVNTDSLIKLSSVSRDTYRIYRPWLMQRMVMLFNLGPNIAIDNLRTLNDVLEKCNSIMSALQERITAETDAIYHDMNNQREHFTQLMHRDCLEPIPDGNVLERRRALRRNIICIFGMPFDAETLTSRIATQALLHFWLSTTERILESNDNPQDFHTRMFNSVAKARTFNTVVIGRMLRNGHVLSGQFLHAWNRFLQEWPALNAIEQAKLLTTLCPFLLNIAQEAAHPALPFIQQFIGNGTHGWAHDVMRQGFAHVVEPEKEDPLSRERGIAILNVFTHIANPGSRCQHKAVLDADCETIQQLLNCSTQEAIYTVRQNHLHEDRFIYIRNNLERMTPQEQVAVLFSFPLDSRLYVGGGGDFPSLPSYRALLRDETLTWAHEAIPRGFSKYIELENEKIEGTHTQAAKNQQRRIYEIFIGIANGPKSNKNFDKEFAAILQELDLDKNKKSKRIHGSEENANPYAAFENKLRKMGRFYIQSEENPLIASPHLNYSIRPSSDPDSYVIGIITGKGSDNKPIIRKLRVKKMEFYDMAIQLPSKKIADEIRSRLIAGCGAGRDITASLQEIKKITTSRKERLAKALELQNEMNFPINMLLKEEPANKKKCLQLLAAILGVESNDIDAIKKTYRTLSLSVHPDKADSPDLFQLASNLWEKSGMKG